MTTTTSFFDTDFEKYTVAACLISSPAIEMVARLLVSADFGSPNAGSAYAAILRLHMDGSAVDAVTVVDVLRQEGTLWDGAENDLVAWMAQVPSPSNAGTYAEIVARLALKRRLHHLGAELQAGAADETVAPADLADGIRERLALLDSPVLAGEVGDQLLAELLAEDDPISFDVIPRLLAEDDRVVTVAPEGVGKSELARQMTVAPAYGVHPFTFEPIPAVPTLLVDLENPRALIRHRLRHLASTAERQAKGERAPLSLWHRPGGIDLRRRADRVALEDVLRRRRPKFVSLGPVYKCYARRASETDEQVAAEVQAILDDLRTRYRFALLLEHHAPHASNGTRELRPVGSSLWLRWPEYGIKLTPHRERTGALVLGRFRGDRGKGAWPDELHRGSTWPWDAWWRDGTP